ncbi:ribosome-associated GTPase EngA [Dehalococcoides mccartyi]|jgi:GTP-binding protein|uniref:ribosome biogenesis GTPase Der n=1 Tax=Dehalococcoides mccartyi TaxID=61435 RepID=UPI0004E08CE0|nr:ribosome biogenesis GTPase Der [Dehalococcoides mccartyi]AII58346.1 GTPase Der [Dehalococcoides mccartyi CG1]APH12921.1 ribosome-associated GTPase EngA [Dehalococcoides mccartyi]
MNNTTPIIAIVGRQNVGKSTLLNRLAHKNLAITEDLPGTTRDRLFTTVSWLDRKLIMVDTGGLDPDIESVIGQQVNIQISLAIKEADLVLLVVDVKTGLVTSDYEMADIIRRTGKPVILVANKADNLKMGQDAAEFYSLGFGEPSVISAFHGSGISDLMDRVLEELPDQPIASPEEDNSVKLALVGRTNVGKSTLLNTFLGQERSIVSNIPGTTRDAIDTPLDFNGTNVLLIDTAGIRRRGKVESGVEKYSVLRALKAVDRADVVLLVMDTEELVTAQDTHIAGYVRDTAKGIIIILNKWDLGKGQDKAEVTQTIQSRFKFLDYAPILFVSGKTGRDVDTIIPMALKVQEERSKRIPTAKVNSVVTEALSAHTPPRQGKTQLKIFYATQAEINPPSFVFFVNNPKLVHFSYERFIENRLRESFGFFGTPIRLTFKARGEKC